MFRKNNMTLLWYGLAPCVFNWCTSMLCQKLKYAEKPLFSCLDPRNLQLSLNPLKAALGTARKTTERGRERLEIENECTRGASSSSTSIFVWFPVYFKWRLHVFLRHTLTDKLLENYWQNIHEQPVYNRSNYSLCVADYSSWWDIEPTKPILVEFLPLNTPIGVVPWEWSRKSTPI